MRWQFYRIAAGGSRESPSGRFQIEAVLLRVMIRRRLIELQSPRPFSGAACCQLTELPPYKAAPLPTGATASRVYNFPVFISHPLKARLSGLLVVVLVVDSGCSYGIVLEFCFERPIEIPPASRVGDAANAQSAAGNPLFGMVCAGFVQYL